MKPRLPNPTASRSGPEVHLTCTRSSYDLTSFTRQACVIAPAGAASSVTANKTIDVSNVRILIAPPFRRPVIGRIPPTRSRRPRFRGSDRESGLDVAHVSVQNSARGRARQRMDGGAEGRARHADPARPD